MTAVLAVAAVLLAGALMVVLDRQRRMATRLTAAGRHLAGDLVPSGAGLVGATSLVERAVDRMLLRGGAVSRAESRLAGALMVIPQGVAVFDGDGQVALTNQAAAGYLTARHGDALVAEAIEEVVAAVLHAGGTSPTRTVELFGPPRRTVVLRAIGLEEADDGLGAVVVIDDVTERRRLEAVRRDFIANISHELKTPVGALGLLAETIVAEEDPQVAHRLAERMLTEAFRVGRTIDDLLELSRIEADDATVHEPTSVRLIVEEAAERTRGWADQQGIAIEVSDVAGSLTVTGDRRQLVSALYNLLENAVKYSDEGSAVQVGATTRGGWVDLVVTDHGMGIPRRDLERIFERFYRVDRARSRETGGTGLGLAIVRHVAANHAGEVRVESREGEGSVFTLRLPLGTELTAISHGAGRGAR